MDDVMVERVRRFNRAVAQRVGALDDRFLARDRPMAEARLLGGTGRGAGVGGEGGGGGGGVGPPRPRLGLDSGHASRLLRSLEGDGLIRVAPSSEDGRGRRAELTAAGVAAREQLARRSDDLAKSFLTPLSPRQRDRLVAAMGDVERLLTAALVE